jgi:hypothetical protein
MRYYRVALSHLTRPFRRKDTQSTMPRLWRSLPLCRAAILVTLAVTGCVRLSAQQNAASTTPAAASLPDAPSQQQASQTKQESQDSQGSQPESQREKAARELNTEEHQRVFGVFPNFNTSFNRDAAPLSPRQKFDLVFHNAVNPFPVVVAAVDAGISQADDKFPGYGQGMTGYGKRFGAAYIDAADGKLWGSAILPIMLREDPRYFRKGTGSFSSRVLYCVSTIVWSKRDNGSWGPNYSKIGGTIIAGGIANVYYPPKNRGLDLVFERAVTVTAESSIGALFNEFWPDIDQKVFNGRWASGADKPNKISPGN